MGEADGLLREAAQHRELDGLPRVRHGAVPQVPRSRVDGRVHGGSRRLHEEPPAGKDCRALSGIKNNDYKLHETKEKHSRGMPTIHETKVKHRGAVCYKGIYI